MGSSEMKLYLHEFSADFGDYVNSYKEYLEVLSTAEKDLFGDFLEPSKGKNYPSEHIHAPRIRKTAKQFIECKKRVRSLLDKLLQKLPKQFQQKKSRNSAQNSDYSSLHKIDMLIAQIEGPENDRDVVNNQARDNAKECDSLLAQFQQFVSNISAQQEHIYSSEVFGIEFVRQTEESIKVNDAGDQLFIPSQSLINKLASQHTNRKQSRDGRTFQQFERFLVMHLDRRFLKCLERSILEFTLLNWFWTVNMHLSNNSYFFIILKV